MSEKSKTIGQGENNESTSDRVKRMEAYLRGIPEKCSVNFIGNTKGVQGRIVMAKKCSVCNDRKVEDNEQVCHVCANPSAEELANREIFMQDAERVVQKAGI